MTLRILSPNSIPQEPYTQDRLKRLGLTNACNAKPGGAHSTVTLGAAAHSLAGPLRGKMRGDRSRSGSHVVVDRAADEGPPTPQEARKMVAGSYALGGVAPEGHVGILCRSIHLRGTSRTETHAHLPMIERVVDHLRE